MIRAIFLGAVSLAANTFGWWDSAHMIVAQIAKENMDEQSVIKAEAILEPLNSSFPQCGTFITAACFPDDLTSIGLAGFKVWHGMLKPYDPECIMTSRELGSIEALISTNNLHLAIRNCERVLSDPDSSPWAKAFMLRFLLHTVADIHQPLHCIQMYSPAFPTGDGAGHRFRLQGGAKNLHAYWDSMLGICAKKLSRPLSPDDETWVIEAARQIMREYPLDTLPEHHLLDIEEWSDESYDLAVQVVYTGIEPNTKPSEAYIARGRRIACRQVALAGYRLAHLLETLLE